MFDNYEDVDDKEDAFALQFDRVTQLNVLREAYARLWRAGANPERTAELERLLEQLLASSDPIKLPDWFLVHADELLPQSKMPINRILREVYTCQHLIDPALKARGWTPQHIRREEVFIHCRDNRRCRVDYALRTKVRPHGQFRLVAFIEAKHEGLSPEYGLELVKRYAAGRHERIPFVFSTNGHFFVQFDRRTKKLYGPYPLNLFPTPQDLLVAILRKDARSD